MTDSTQPASGDSSQNDGATGTPPSQQFATIEEAVAYERNRQSGMQRAHNAEVESLQRQMDALRNIGSTQPSATTEHPDTVRARELEAALVSERTANALRAKYPDAANLLGDDIAKVAEEHLAAVNAVFTQQQQPPPAAGGPPIIDPNSPPRTPQGGVPGLKKPEDMNEEELIDTLRGMTPAYQAMIAER